MSRVMRRTVRTTTGEALEQGVYVLTISETGRASAMRLTTEQSRRIVVEILGAE